MYCTGAELCKFYVWCSDPEERVCIDVLFDEVFLNEIISNARKFYFQHLLVRIVDDFIAKRLTLCQEYNELCNSI